VHCALVDFYNEQLLQAIASLDAILTTMCIVHWYDSIIGGSNKPSLPLMLFLLLCALCIHKQTNLMKLDWPIDPVKEKKVLFSVSNG
jgi:hypothetical protein